MLCTNHLLPYVIIMVTILIVSLISMNFTIALERFTNTRPLIVDHLLIYSWILVQLVNQNRETLAPTIVIPPCWLMGT